MKLFELAMAVTILTIMFRRRQWDMVIVFGVLVLYILVQCLPTLLIGAE